MEVNRDNIVRIWFYVSVISSVLGSVASMLYWELVAPDDWSFFKDTLGMFMIMPFGWLHSIITPIGWLNLAGLGIAIYKSSFKPLIFSAIASMIFGLFLPWYSQNLMGI